jgi:hypothetical protein
MDRETAIAKIKKCLALGRSANEHEAAAAMRQAQALMRLHGITDEALQLSDVSEAGAAVRSMALPVWEVRLARAVAEAFGCEMYVQRGHRLAFESQHRRHKFQFVGMGAAAQIAAYAHDVLAGQCAKARLAHIAEQPKRCKPITKTARGDAFAAAWVYAVCDLLDRFANGERSKALLEAYMEAQHPGLTNFKPKARDVGRNVKDDSRLAGLAAGLKADLKRGLSQDAEQGLLA